MSRRDRAIELTPWHHVTNRGARRQVIFHTDEQRLLFGGLIGEAHERFGVGVIAYCLMDNHFHLVLDVPDGGMSEFMHRISGAFARSVNDELGTDGPLFRGRFASRPIMSHEYLVNAVRYVHRNPLDISSATTVESYRWSSHRTYLGLRSTPPWLRSEAVLNHYTDPSSFHQFVAGEAPPLTDGRLEAPLLLGAIEQVIDEAVLPGAVQGLVRNIAALLLDFLPPRAAAELDTELGFGSDDTRRRAGKRARELARSNPDLARLARRAVELTTGCAVLKLSADSFSTAQAVGGVYGAVA